MVRANLEARSILSSRGYPQFFLIVCFPAQAIIFSLDFGDPLGVGLLMEKLLGCVFEGVSSGSRATGP